MELSATTASRVFPQTLEQPAAPATEVESVLSHSLYALIAQQPFFQGLSTHHLRLLADSALEVQFASGETVFQEGSPANRFYLILEGKVVIESELEERGLIHIQTLGPGDDLGWSWLFPPYLLHSSARAVEPTKTLFFYGTRLREQCEQDHDLGYQLMKRIADAVMQHLRAVQRRLIESAARESHHP